MKHESAHTLIARLASRQVSALELCDQAIARIELGHHYRKGWESGNQAGRPRFEQPVQNLPEHAVPGDLVPLRSGRDPYAPAASGVQK